MPITDKNTIQKYYKALVEKDSGYIGIFYVGVTTTGIFCIPTCRARKPKRENVEFYTEVKELLQHGYRACKICKPTEHSNSPPKHVIQAMNMASKSANKMTDYQMRKVGISPERVRRWFQKTHGMTFQGYLRMMRINTALEAIKEGNSVTSSAFSSGYESLSGFGYSFKNVVGATPKKGIEKDTVLLSRITTPLGPMFIGSTKKGICLLEFTDRRMLETELKDIGSKLNRIILMGENKHITKLKYELAEYFEGKLKTFTADLDTHGTEFQKTAWNALMKIPYGETRSYGQQAMVMNNPKAVRAVGLANGANRISIVIPCHRVIGANGKLTGYGGGLERKKWLLHHEQTHLL